MYIQGSRHKIYNRFLVTWKKLTRLEKVDTETEVLISVY